MMWNKLVYLKKRFLSEWYPKILEDFRFDYNLDLVSAKILRRMVVEPRPLLKTLSYRLRDRDVLLFAPGPSLQASLDKMEGMLQEMSRHMTILAVDGAYRALAERDLEPHILVTDLDGLNYNSLSWSSGLTIVLHAHGDNIAKIKEYPRRLLDRTVGTCQVDLNGKILNIGGFTDGDRALCLCEVFEAETVFLVGMDFGYRIGLYSKPYLKSDIEAGPMKRRKMVYAMKIIKDLLSTSRLKYYNLFQGSELDIVPPLKYEDFKKLMDNKLKAG